MLTLTHLLQEGGVDPARTLVMRHRPWETHFRPIFSGIARTRPDLFNAYQSVQFSKAEMSLSRASWLASCIGEVAGEALLVGIYQVAGFHRATTESQRLLPENIELAQLGNEWPSGAPPEILHFDLERLPQFSAYETRLVLTWSKPERSWFRWADRNNFPISRYLSADQSDPPMPNWRELTLTWAELKALPSTWAARLQDWRGVYLIFDTSEAKAYVGSAGGEDNILGRWLNYAASGDGGNKLLKGRDPRNFRFSILERLSPDIAHDKLVRAEAGWKVRLSSREFGLNAN